MTSYDRLVPIATEDLPILRDLYKKNWPKYRIPYHTITHFTFWLETYNVEDLLVWSLNDSWRENGTVIIKNHRDIHFATLDSTQETLVRALCLMDWSGGPLICGFEEHFRPAIRKAAEIANFPIVIEDSLKLFTLTREKARALQKVDLDEGLTIRRLTVEDASIANDLWRYKNSVTEVLLQKMAKYNICYGAYTPTDKLVGWIFITPYGAIGVLHILEEFRGKKIAQALVIQMIKYLIDTFADLEPYAFIDALNVASIKLFEKLGFEDQHELGYFIYTNSDI
ncbi:uncharacterized protein LOC132255882 [Phlebotomus argentipes]|uniref:uncharacterized protein LOC132255882 n=1 Tax=Phlebotomus argentipes TaxID=94469 RepID=UPI002893049F|nr:uncharacterized protein LOC132255882 [Phlebotomus argentipes]